MIDSIIFDIDGTLLDSRQQVRQAWGQAIQQLTGRPWQMSDKDFTALFGLPMDQIALRLFPDEDDPIRRGELANACYCAENEWLWQHPGKLFPQVPQVLEALSRHFPLFIVSNCQSGYIQAAVGPHGLLDLFQGWLCYGDTHAPKSVTLTRLVQQHGLRSPIYVGDTQGDQEACREAHIPFVYAAYGFGQADHPDATIHAFTDLLSLCKGGDCNESH